MKSRKSKSFTLLELLLALSLMALCLGILGMRLPKMMKEKKFEKEVGLLLTKLQLAHEIALDLDDEVVLEFKQAEKAMFCYFHLPDCAPHLQKGLNLASRFEEIQEIRFNGVTASHLCFHVRSATPKGKVSLLGGGKRADFIFGGFPGKISKSYDYETSEVPFPEKALSFI